ncbi:MAG TPA: ABC transporter ATP-binding protein [Herpetosiphonaceae bacterium]|nr:ABC transporter ATP-binding protein [Herpetosiphonaceae bacterium]
MTLALELGQVTVSYGALPALADVSLSASHGEILGLLGPNGAGKTTLLRVILGFARPGPGATVRVLGADPQATASASLRARIGFVPDPDGLDPRLTGERMLDELAALGGRPPLDRAAVCAAIELRPADLRRRIGALSRGTRQKVALAQGLQHRPDLIILDEPSEGLDPFARRGLAELLAAARARGAAVLFSSHVLSEIEEICDRVAVIRRGRIATVASLAELRGRAARRVWLRLGPAADSPDPAAHGFSPLDGGWGIAWTGEIAPLLATLANWPIADLSIAPPGLAAQFASLYGEAADG